MDLASRLKKPARRSQLPFPKKYLPKPKCAVSQPELNVTQDLNPRSYLSKKDPDVVPSSSASTHVSTEHEKGDNRNCWENAIGSRVCVGGEKFGTLLYYGHTQFAKGIWCGIRLDEAVGKNNGTVEGQKYFTCPQGYGIFAPTEKVNILNEVSPTIENADALNATFVACSNSIKPNKEFKNKNFTNDNFESIQNAMPKISDTSYVINHSATPCESLKKSFYINNAKDSPFQPDFESTPNNVTATVHNCNLNTTAPVPNCNLTTTFLNLDADEESDVGDLNSNNEDLSELGNAQGGFGPQCSMEHDESLGILTPDQMPDFTLPMDSIGCHIIQTPSDEGIQEIVEEVVDPVAEDIKDNSETTPVEFVNGSVSNWETEWEKDYVWNANIADFKTPNFKNDRLHILSSNTEDESMLSTTLNESKMAVLQPDVLNDSVFVSKSTVSEFKERFTLPHDKLSASPELNIQEKLDEGSFNKTLTQQLSFEGVDQKQEVWSGLNDYLANEFVKPDREEIIACQMETSEMDGLLSESMELQTSESVELQNLLRVAIKKDMEKPAEMAVSATSIDTGYQGDLDCDMQSDSGTNPISTPVDDKQLLDSLQISLEQRLGSRIDPGSDSDFCSDMGASWTESEMDMEDKGGQRGNCRSARIIDGRLYYGGATTSRESRASTVTKDHSLESDNRCGSLPNSEAATYEVEPAVSEEVIDEKEARNDILKVDETPIQSSESQQTLTSLESYSLKIEGSSSPAPSASSCVLVQDSSNDTLNTTVVGLILENSSSSTQSINSSGAAKSSKKQEIMKNNKNKTPNKKSNKDVVIDKSKTPKKNVMSKIKAMIGGSSSNKSSSPNSAADSESPPKPKEIKKQPLKNKWTPVMSKIAANRIEEEKRPKVKKEVASRVNSNFSQAKTNGHPAARSTKPEFNLPIVPHGRANVKSSPASNVLSAKVIHKPPTLTRLRDSKSKVVTDSISEHISSQNLSSKSRLPVCERPSTLSLRKLDGSSRSISEVSLISRDSQGTTMSQLTLNSHLSSKPHLNDVSSVSTRSNRVNGSSNKLPNSKPTPNKPTNNHSPRAAKRPVNGHAAHQQKKTLRNDKIAPKDGHQLKSNHASSNGIVKSGQQPDLLPPTIGKTFYSQEISRLEALCETRTKELNVVQMQLKHCAKGFDSMIVLINYLSNDINAFAMPTIQEELSIMQEKYRQTDFQLREYIEINEDLSKKIGLLQDKHMLELEKVKNRFKEELELRQKELGASHQSQLDTLSNEHNRKQEAIKSEMLSKIENLKEDFKLKEKSIVEDHKLSLEKLKVEHENELSNATQSYVNKISDLEKNVKELEDLKVECANLEKQKSDLQNLLNSDADVKVQVICGQRDNLKKEVDSLEAVLEMKMNEIKKLQQDNLRLDEVTEELYNTKENFKKVLAKNEDLSEMIHSKIELERTLSSNNEVLTQQCATKNEDNKRLSLENETLQWKLRQSMSIGANSEDGHPHNSVNYYYFWDDEGMCSNSSSKSGLMSSSWNGCSSTKNGSPCSPRDRLTWSPSHSYSKQLSQSTFTSSHRSHLKVENERNQGSKSPPLNLKLNSKSKKRSVTTSTPASEAVGCPLKANSQLEVAKSEFLKIDKELEALSECSFDEIPQLEQNSLSPVVNFENNSVYESVEKYVKELIEDLLESVEIECGRSVNDENCKDTESQIEMVRCSVAEDDFEGHWDNAEHVSTVEDDEIQMPEFENLYMMSMTESGYLQTTTKTDSLPFFRESSETTSCQQLVRIDDDSCVKSLTRSSEVSFPLDLLDHELIFPSFQDELEELVLEAPSLTGENDGMGDINETSTSSEEMLGSLEDTSSVITATETSSKETMSTNEESNLSISNSKTAESNDAIPPKTTTTVVITFRPNPITRTFNCSSRDSSPEQHENNPAGDDICEEPNMDDPSSSSRASPSGLDESFSLDKTALQSLSQNGYGGTQSPRTSAGEALMADTDGLHMNIHESHRHQLLKKALQDQLPHSGSTSDSTREFSSEDCSPLVGLSKPDTPDLFTSASVTDAPIVSGLTNTDDSWSYSDDDLPSETEI